MDGYSWDKEKLEYCKLNDEVKQVASGSVRPDMVEGLKGVDESETR